MRKFTAKALQVFVTFLILIIISSVLATRILLSVFTFGEFTGVIYTLVFLIFLYLTAIFTYRLFLRFFPLEEGIIEPDSKLEFTYQVYLLFYLIFFYILTRSRTTPVGPMRLVYLLLGAKLGDNTFCSGTILDPPLTIIGSNTILGQDCILYAHAMEGDKLSHAKIRIGNNVTIGANAVIMAGVTIEDGAIVGAGSVITKGKTIGSQEVWCGVPGTKIKTLSS